MKLLEKEGKLYNYIIIIIGRRRTVSDGNSSTKVVVGVGVGVVT